MKRYAKTLKMYHGQAKKDIYAEIPDLGERIISTTMKEIHAAYQDELLSDLLFEAQEAY